MEETEATPAKPEYVEPSRAEMKAALKDETLPAIVRRNIRERLYGENAGRKAEQQKRLLREHSQFKPGQQKTDGLKRPAGMSGRQFRIARKLINRGRKVIFGKPSIS